MIKKTRNTFGSEQAGVWFMRARQPRNFSVNANATYQFKCVGGDDESAEVAGDGEGPKTLVRICSPMKFVRKVNHLNGDRSVDCVFIDSDGQYVLVSVPNKDLLTNHVVTTLSAKGLKFYASKNLTGSLRLMYNDVEPDLPVVRVVAKQGVQKSGAIVLDDLVLGDEPDLVIDPDKRRGFSTQGTHDQWIENVSLRALSSATAVFAIAHSLAAYLKFGAGLQNAVFNFYGPSTRGKTSALYASASTMGLGTAMVATWHASDPGFEDDAKKADGWSWIVDEARIGLGDKSEEHIVFAITNGRSKSKAKGYGGAGVELGVWALSSQEARQGDPYLGQPRSGADVRLFAIPVGYDRERGIFEQARDQGHAKAIADGLAEACKHYHGTAIIEFGVRLLGLSDWRGEIQVRVQVARNAILGDRSLPALRLRGLDSFAVVAAGGEWATELGVTGWKPGEATNAVKAMFDAWCEGPPRDYWSETNSVEEIDNASDEDEIAAKIARHARPPTLGDKAADATIVFLRAETPVPLETLTAQGRYPDPKDRDCPVFLFTRPAGTLLCVAPTRLKHVLGGLDSIAARKLRSRETLVANGQKDSLRYTIKIAGKPENFYAFAHDKVVGVGVQP